MDVILNYLSENKLFGIVLILTIAYLLSRLVAMAPVEKNKDHLVPRYKRFERREGESGDRRQLRALAFTGLERRSGMRRVRA